MKIKRTSAEADLVRDLLAREARWLRSTIREADSLSSPCPPGRWRWADVDPSGYRRKTDDELADMYARNQGKAARARARLDLLEGLYRELLK